LVAITYKTRLAGEVNVHKVVTAHTPECVADELRTYDLTEHLLDYRAGRQFEERQAKIERTLAQRYDAAVSEILTVLEPEVIE
jgi:hypothetical protein